MFMALICQTASEFVAHNRDNDAICQAIGADRLIYQDLQDLIDSVRAGNPSLNQFDCSCFTGDYITGDVDDAYFIRVVGQAERSI